MPAYVISEVEFLDPVGVDRYRAIAQATIAAFGGRYLVRGGTSELAEGGPEPKALIIAEFPSMERLKEWYGSPEYAEGLAVARTALKRRLIFVEGVAPA